jgi:glycosyltransferase involved in cell wall biosynthesis
MLGWEFPPSKTGGLGTHCYELVKNLGVRGVNVLFLVPKRSEKGRDSLCNVDFVEVGFDLSNPYAGPDSISDKSYGTHFVDEVVGFNKKCVELALDEEYDVIHCHDWMTIPAGIELKKKSGTPLVFTVHSTEFDRTIEIDPSVNIVGIERAGIDESDQIITVSEGMKKQLVERYGAFEERVRVIYNGIDRSRFPGITKKTGQRIVLFLGRLTNQKGPSFFLQTAAIVLRKVPDALFIVAGHGGKLQELIEESIALGIMDHVCFRGYLSEEELVQAYEMADVYVMPSVAEPFGISALEAIASGTPVIISKNAGVSEQIKHCLKVDYWDTLEMANKIICMLKHTVLGECMRRNAIEEIRDFGWDEIAEKTIKIYERLR